MEPMIGFLAIALSLSLACNAFQAYIARSLKKKPRPDTTAADLLHDLTRQGQAVIRVEVIDPANLFLRSPRG